MQGSAQLYVQVLDYDGGNRFQHIDDIYVLISLNPGSVAERTTTGDHNRGTIVLSFQLECLPEFYGRNCSILCEPFNDKVNGHFTCGQNGERVCRNGWQDPGNRCLTRKVLIIIL